MNDRNVVKLDDVKPADRRKLNALDVKTLSEDGAFWIALLACVSTLYPPFGEWVKENQEAFMPLLIVLAGHFGVRISAAASKGKVLSRGDSQ